IFSKTDAGPRPLAPAGSIWSGGLPPPIKIRPAEPADAQLIFSLIVELAEYERARESVTGSPGLLARALFGPDPSAEALIAEAEGDPDGLASVYRRYST